MKRFLCGVFAGMMAIGLTACGKLPAAPQSEDRPNVEPSASITAPGEPETAETECLEVPAEEPTGSGSELCAYTLYVPNDNADGFDVITIQTDVISAENVLAELKTRNILPDAVSMHCFAVEDGLITIDFNQAFADVVCSMGTSGELMVVGSVVNTFLDAFQAESVSFTVDGQVLESGHTIYDFALRFFALNP